MHPDGPKVGGQQSSRHRQGGRLAGTVRPDDAVERADRDVQVETGDGDGRAEPFVEAAHGEGRGGRRRDARRGLGPARGRLTHGRRLTRASNSGSRVQPRAPGWLTEAVASAVAYLSATSGVRPTAMAAANAPCSTSPAPRVSTISPGGALTGILPRRAVQVVHRAGSSGPGDEGW